MMGPHKNLKVWQSGMDFVTEIYQLTAGFPTSEIYGLVSQMRRAAVSITANIAEGYGRSSNQEVIHFLQIFNFAAMDLHTISKFFKSYPFL